MNYKPYNWNEGEEVSIERLQSIERGVEDLSQQEDLVFAEEVNNKIGRVINFVKSSDEHIYILDEDEGYIEPSSYFTLNQYLNAYNMQQFLKCVEIGYFIQGIIPIVQKKYYFIEGEEIIFNDLNFRVEIRVPGTIESIQETLNNFHLIIKRTIPSIAHIEDSTKSSENQEVSLICINPLSGEEVEIERKINITVLKNLPHEIKITTLPDKINYNVGDVIDLTGAVITAYDENDIPLINISNDEFLFSPLEITSLDEEQNISIIWSNFGLTKDFSISVSAIPNGIKIFNLPTDPFYKREELNFKKIKAMIGIYVSNFFIPIEENVQEQDLIFSDSIAFTSEENPGVYFQTITVSYNELETTFDIKVKIPNWSDISWATSSDRELTAAIRAARAEEINLQTNCGWRIGDVRKIITDSVLQYNDTYTPSQEMEIVITSFNEYIERGRNEIHYGNVLQFDFNNCLNGLYRLNSSTTPTTGDLSKLEIEFILNNLIKGNLKKNLIPMNYEGRSDGPNLYLRLRSKSEILILPYYQNIENRKKRRIKMDESVESEWWLDLVLRGDGKLAAQYVKSDGQVGGENFGYADLVTAYKGLALFGLM